MVKQPDLLITKGVKKTNDFTQEVNSVVEWMREKENGTRKRVQELLESMRREEGRRKAVGRAGRPDGYIQRRSWA